MLESLEILNWLRQLTREYKCNNLLLAPYFTVSIQLLDFFDYVEFEHVPSDKHEFYG